jgi:hypothetical protein
VNRPRRLVPWIVLACLAASAPARADVPAGYKGKPFDPAVAGGKGIIPATVKAGPYAIPGRLDLINYDLGGVGVAYDCTHHEVKGGDGYRTDQPTASLSLTAASKMDVWFQAGAGLDGTHYPSATSEDFYVGALDAPDWFNYTVDVKTAGTYAVSSTWATGNGPPGGMGGDGSMGIQISVNGTKMVDWTATLPNDQTTADYHHWKPYPNFATLTLAAGLQVIKVQLTASHLNLDYLELALVGADGGAAGAAGGDAGAGGASASGDAGAGAGGTAGANGSAGASGGGSGAAGAAGGAAGASAPTGAAGSAAGTAGASGAAGASASGAAGSAPKAAHGSSGCRLSGGRGPGGAWALGLAAVAIAAALARSARRRP